MATQRSTAVRDAMNDAFESAVGTAPTLEIRTGAPPANCAEADSGSLLCSITLPSDWLTASSGGSKSRSGTWQANASGSGDAGHYRIKQGGTCHEQGTAGGTDPGTADMVLQQTGPGIVSGQQVTISSYTATVGGA